MTLYYDPTGRLSRLTQSASTTKFEYLGPRLVIERNAAGTILRRYVHGPGDDEPVVWYEGATLTDKRWLHTDERGSVIAISNAAGTSIATNRYDEYGIPQSTNSGRFQYTGQAWVPELGPYYYKARFYSPTLGRFMQTDPIGYKDGINWYDYVHGDPVNKVDPDGQCVGPLAIPCGAVVVEKVLEGIVILGAACVAWCPRPELPTRDQPAVTPPPPPPTTVTPPAPRGPTVSEAKGSHGGQGKGERGKTGSRHGTDNPGKKENPGRGTRTDPHTGKKKPLPPPPKPKPPEPEVIPRGKKKDP